MLLCLVLCVPWRGALERLWSPWEGGPGSQLSRSKRPVSAPRRSPASLQPADVLFQQVWSKNRAELLPTFSAVLGQQAFTQLSKVELSTERLKGGIYFCYHTKGLASLLSNLLLSYLGGTAGHCINQKELGTGRGPALIFPSSWLGNCICFDAPRKVAGTTINVVELGRPQQKMVVTGKC